MLPSEQLPEMQERALRSARRLVLCAADASKRRHRKKLDNKRPSRPRRRSSNRRPKLKPSIKEPQIPSRGRSRHAWMRVDIRLSEWGSVTGWIILETAASQHLRKETSATYDLLR